MKSFLYTLGSTLFATVALSPLFVSSAAAQQANLGPDGICSSVASADYLLTESQVLLSHDAGGALLTRNLQSPIPAGTYNIDALSYEPQHPNDPIPGQTKEQWRINLFDASGAVIFTSGPTVDIPDADQTTLTRLATNISLASAVTSIQYVHYGWPELDVDPDDYVYNSVIPACVAFTNIADDIAVIPSCTVTLAFMDGSTTEVMATYASQGVADGAVVTIDWGDDSDLETLIGVKGTHTYSKSGAYTVKATVTSNQKTVATCATSIDIESPALTIVDSATDTPVVDAPQEDTPEEESPKLTAVLAATGISPFVSAFTGVGLASAGVAVRSFRRK